MTGRSRDRRWSTNCLFWLIAGLAAVFGLAASKAVDFLQESHFLDCVHGAESVDELIIRLGNAGFSLARSGDELVATDGLRDELLCCFRVDGEEIAERAACLRGSAGVNGCAWETRCSDLLEESTEGRANGAQTGDLGRGDGANAAELEDAP